MSAQVVRVTHFSDLLCVWAYVSQIRIDELCRHFGAAVQIEYRYLPVFGNVPRKMESGWRERGGLAAYNAHVREVAARFDHVALNRDCWLRDTPLSSLPSHLFLCAVRLLQEEGVVPGGTLERTAWALREAFFRDCADISRAAVLRAIAGRLALPLAAIEQALDNGAAHAGFAEDLDLARGQNIQASPTLVFNEGRQRLSGNVGYRIIEANIRELVEEAPGQQSWC